MDVWTLYVSSHNGKPPRNAFDLVNFSRSTDHTLTFKKAKQIYQETRKIDRETNVDSNASGDHYLAPSNQIQSEDDEPPILKSPKHIKKRKSSYSSSRRNSKISKHKQSISHNNYSTRFNEDAVLKESEDTNYDDIYIDNRRHKIYTSTTSISIIDNNEDEESTEDEHRVEANDIEMKLKAMRIKTSKVMQNNRHKLEDTYRETDSEGNDDSDSDKSKEDEYNIYKRKRRTKNQSSPISLNRRNYAHQISKSQTIEHEESRTRKRARAQIIPKLGNRLNNKRFTKHKSEKYRVKNNKQHKKKHIKKKETRVIVASSPRYIQRQRKKAKEREKERKKNIAPSSASTSTSSSSSSSTRQSSSSAASSSSSSNTSSDSSDIEAKSDESSEHKLKLRSFSRSSDTNRKQSRHKRVHSDNNRVKKSSNNRNKWNEIKNKRKSTMQIPLKKRLKLKQRIDEKRGRKSHQNLIVKYKEKASENEKERKNSRKRKHKHKKKEEEFEFECNDENITQINTIKIKRSSSADPRIVNKNIETRHNKKVKPKPRAVRKVKKKDIKLKMSRVQSEIVTQAAAASVTLETDNNFHKRRGEKEKEKHFKFRVGDVVLVHFDQRGDDLARIRFFGSTVLDSENCMFGVECFKFQFNAHEIAGFRVNDGSIAGSDKLFEVKKNGYATFIKYDAIKSNKCLWNLKMSKHALKVSEFESSLFISAAKYGSLKVIKHLLRILLKKYQQQQQAAAAAQQQEQFQHASKSIRKRSRSNNNNNHHNNNNIYNNQDIFTIEEGFAHSVLNNHTKIVKMILTHFGSNNTSFTMYSFNSGTKKTHAKNKNKNKKKTKSLTDFVIKNGMQAITNNKAQKPSLRARASSGASSVSSINTDSDFDDEYDEDLEVDENDDYDDEKHSHFIRNRNYGMSKFYRADLFDLVCEQQNFQMLQILIEYDSWPLLSPSSRGLYSIFCSCGYLKWIKYLLEISPYIVNMPLLSNNLDSTMMIASISHNRFAYAKYILSTFGDQLQLAANQSFPILLIIIMNLNCKNLCLATDILQSVLLHVNDCNWAPSAAAKQCLKHQQHLFASQEIFDLIDEELRNHQLTYYHLAINSNDSPIILGSVLAAMCYKSLAIYRDIKNSKLKTEILHYLSDLLSTFMLYGIDFNQKNEFQHVWMTYDSNSFRWNLSNFPYNVCNTKQELLFLQKMFKKALKKYPIKLLNTCEMILIDQNNPNKYPLIEIFKKYIIPYAIYDALIFESLHFCAPNETDLDLSEPESVDFMFAYQRSPVVE